MRNSEERFDQEIAGLVRGVERGVPEALDRRIAEAAARLDARVERARKRRPWLLALVPATAIVSALVVFQAVRPEPREPISEIRTEFEIADKNIKIIFFQKPDFHLHQEERNAQH